MAAAYPAAGSLPVFSVVLFNTQDGSDRYTGEGSTERRYSCIQEMLQIIQSECQEPLFILCQEDLLNKEHVFLKNLLTENHYSGRVVFKKEEAGYAYRLDSPPEQYVITPMDQNSLVLAAEDLPPELKTYTEDIFKGQLAFVLRLNNEGGKNMLCVSYHGRYKKTDIEKLASFRTLIHVFERLRVIKACYGVLIGGDFNLQFHKVVGVNTTPVSDFPLKSCKTFDDIQVCITGLTVQDRKDVMDYIVYWPVDLYDTCQIRDLRRNYMKKSPRPFDHPVLLYRLQIHQKTVHEVLMEWFKSASSRAANHLPTSESPEWTIRLCFNFKSQPTEKEELFEIRGSCLAKLEVKITVEKKNRVYVVEKKEITVFQYFGARSSRIPKQFEKQMKEFAQMTEDHHIRVEWYLSSVWRPCPALEGISGANTKLFCLWCHCVTGVPDRQRPTGSDGGNGDPQELLPWVGFNLPVRTECLLQEKISRILFSMVVSRCSSSQKERALTRQLEKYGLISLVQLVWNVIDPKFVSAGDLKVITGNLNVKEIFGVNRDQPGTSVDAVTESMEALTLEESQWGDNMQELLTSFNELMKELHSDTVPQMTSDTFEQKAKVFADLFRQSAAADTDVTLYSSCLENHAPHAYEIRLRQPPSLPTAEPARQTCNSTQL